jgi:hypothetical protein
MGLSLDVVQPSSLASPDDYQNLSLAKKLYLQVILFAFDKSRAK